MKCEDWGLIDYKEALNKQLCLLQKIREKSEEESLIFCTHPSVVTLGRGTKAEDISPSWKGPTYEVSRGGRATYHGPSQLMIYSLIDISKKNRKLLKQKDLPSYLRLLEDVFIEALKPFGIFTKNLRLKKNVPHSSTQSLTGVWIGPRKLVSIGVAFKHWISYHGASINLEKDKNAFQGIHPCGFSSEIMLSVEEILNKKISRDHFKEVLKKVFFQKFDN